jgi:hypothetical protein
VEIKPDKMTAKSELAQGKPEEARIAIAKHLKTRGGGTDMETIRAFGLSPDRL